MSPITQVIVNLCNPCNFIKGFGPSITICNVVCTDAHCCVKVIATLVLSLCFRLVASLGSGRAGGGAVSTPQQVGGTGSCPITVTGPEGHQSPQSFWG